MNSIALATVEWGVWAKPVILDAIREEAPVGKTRQLEMFGGKDAGTTLKASLKGRTRGRVGLVVIEVVAGVSYAIIIRDGRGTIVPKKAKVLHWVNDAGEDVFSMRSGPVKANPYPKRGWEKVRSHVRTELSKRVAAAGMREILQNAKAGGLITRL